jgi:hypothetical protein
MLWQSGGEEGLSHAERFRRVHERWLTWALRTTRPLPRIPLRREDEGGFDRMMARPGGRELAERWWTLAMAIADVED